MGGWIEGGGVDIREENDEERKGGRQKGREAQHVNHKESCLLYEKP